MKWVSGEGDLFVQEEWTEVFEHLACVDVGDITLPMGDVTPMYCPDPAQKGKFKIEDFVRGEAGAGTYTLTRPLSTVANWLLEIECSFEALLTYACAGLRATPENYDIAAVVFGNYPTSSTLSTPVVMEPGGNVRINTNMDVSFIDRRLVYRLALVQQEMDNLYDAYDVAFLPKKCADKCSGAIGLCEIGYMALGDGAEFYGELNSEVKYTKNYGSTWTQTLADPFTYGGGACCVVVLMTADGHIVIVGRGEIIDGGGGGSPAETAWSTDWGTTWNNVWMGDVAGLAINDMFHYGGKIWAACDDGYIYMSSDLALSWTMQQERSGVTEDINGICMYSNRVGYAVGGDNDFYYTLDGGTLWAVDRIGPAPGMDLLCVAVNDKGHIYVGANDGVLYYSTDGGLTWFIRQDYNAGLVTWIAFDEELRYFGGLTHVPAAGVNGIFYRSKDGGASWQAPINQPNNNGLNAGFICDQNNFIVVGDVYGAGNTTYVAKAQPVA